MAFREFCLGGKRLWYQMEEVDSRVSFILKLLHHGQRAAKGNFKASRGLWQGEPLSSFLFRLVVDILGSLIAKTRDRGLVEGFLVGKEKVQISHLQFVDDTILFSSEDEVNFKILLPF